MKQLLIDIIEERANELSKMAKDIWSNPELGMEEFYASKLQKDYMKKNGFSIEEIEGVPTGFVASYGTEGPIVGLIGEYDALSGLSQLEGVDYKAPANSENTNGHGCGHNLLGVSCIGAAIAIKDAIDKGLVKCRVRYYGCPAEEPVIGKVVMANKGVFDDLDFAVSTHPWDRNAVMNLKMPAVIMADFNFKGLTAHAGLNPEDGRSALDAQELMNVGSNYIREHMESSSRIHYIITNGGESPNIVPDKASSKYTVRAKSIDEAKKLFERVVKCAKGAAMMTETEVDFNILTNCYDYVASAELLPVAEENLKWAGPINFTEEEEAFGKKLSATVDQDLVKKHKAGLGIKEDKAMSDSEVHIMTATIGGSTDLGNVSYIAPTVCVGTACSPVGIAAHTWQATSSYGSSIGSKGMLSAAKAMAGIVFDVCNKPEILEAAKKSHQEKGLKYEKSSIGMK